MKTTAAYVEIYIYLPRKPCDDGWFECLSSIILFWEVMPDVLFVDLCNSCAWADPTKRCAAFPLSIVVYVPSWLHPFLLRNLYFLFLLLELVPFEVVLHVHLVLPKDIRSLHDTSIFGVVAKYCKVRVLVDVKRSVIQTCLNSVVGR